MLDFKAIIVEHAQNGAPFEELEEKVVALLKGQPQESSDLLQVLADSKEEGLISDSQYNHLLSQLVAADTIAATDTGTEDAHRTRDPRQFFSQNGYLDRIETVGPGTIIKDRFELLEVLGEGGMGMVYKARDLIKVEAKDRNPYLAIKVLNDNFKKHPESFISLQRECSRTQKLAHPNIATVYDFDRYGSMVYMTMQLLEGKPLNDFIKVDVPPGGLSYEEAMPLIEDMGNALIYAHSKHIVHSDFKPGNAFVTQDHGVEVLDFGIARAVKRPGQQDTTLFDAGKLGALTPAYASCEMLEEEEPDPRDDIYALAVVSYILLSGEHPFDKFPATLARDHGMVAKPLKKLSRSQNKALQKGLAFHRDECSADVQEFLDGMKGSGGNTGKYTFAAVVTLVALILLSIYPIQSYLQKQREADVVQLLSSTDSAIIEDTLSTLHEREDISIDNVLSQSRDSLVAYYSQQINAALTGDRGPNNFQLAQYLYDEVRQWYPESVQVKQLSQRIDHHRFRVIDFVDSALQKVVNERDLTASGTDNSVPKLFELLHKAEPGHALRKDSRIPIVYAILIEDAIAAKRMLDADEMLKTASALYPKNQQLQFLRAEMDRFSDAGFMLTPAQERQDDAARKARQVQREESLELSIVEAAKRSVLIKTQAGRPDKAEVYFNILKGKLPPDALFITDIAPSAIAESYQRLAQSMAEAGQYDRALDLLKSGLEVSPDHPGLHRALEKYKKAVSL